MSFHTKKLLSLVMNLFSFLHRMGKENRARWLGLHKEGGFLGQYPTSATMLKRKETQDVWELPGQCRLSLPLGKSGPTQQEVQSKLSK